MVAKKRLKMDDVRLSSALFPVTQDQLFPPFHPTDVSFTQREIHRGSVVICEIRGSRKR